MNKTEQENHFNEITALMKHTLLSKGGDYASFDRLSNFKTTASIIGTTPELSCLNLIAVKVARLGVLLNSKDKPKNESIQDSVLDLANYAILLHMILNDK